MHLPATLAPIYRLPFFPTTTCRCFLRYATYPAYFLLPAALLMDVGSHLRCLWITPADFVLLLSLPS